MEKNKKLKYWANVGICAVLAGCVSMVLSNTTLSDEGLQFSDPKPSTAATDKVVLSDYRLASGAGQQVMGEFIVKNDSEQEIKNIDVKCVFLDKDGKNLDRELWLLSDRIPAGKTMRYVSKARRFVHTGADNLKCMITDFEVATAPLFAVHRVEGGHGAAADHGDAQGAAPAAHH